MEGTFTVLRANRPQTVRVAGADVVTMMRADKGYLGRITDLITGKTYAVHGATRRPGAKIPLEVPK